MELLRAMTGRGSGRLGSMFFGDAGGEEGDIGAEMFRNVACGCVGEGLLLYFCVKAELELDPELVSDASRASNRSRGERPCGDSGESELVLLFAVLIESLCCSGEGFLLPT
jgi:hypothetical protein